MTVTNEVVKIKDLKGEFDVDRGTRRQSDKKVSPSAHVTRPEVDSTSSGTAKQTVHLYIKPSFDLLTAKDDKHVYSFNPPGLWGIDPPRPRGINPSGLGGQVVWE